MRAMAEETIYLCRFRVSVDGDWLCLRELADVRLEVDEPMPPADAAETEDGGWRGGGGAGTAKKYTRVFWKGNIDRLTYLFKESFIPVNLAFFYCGKWHFC